MRKPNYAYAKTKTAKLISAFVFVIQIVQPLSYLYPDFKLLPFFCDCSVWCVSDLVGNPEDRISRVMAHILFYKISMNLIRLLKKFAEHF